MKCSVNYCIQAHVIFEYYFTDGICVARVSD